MRKLLSCDFRGSPNLLCLRFRPTFYLKASQTIMENTWLNSPSPSQILLPPGIPTRLCIYIKSICFVRLKFAVPLGKHFSTLIFGILDVGLQP